MLLSLFVLAMLSKTGDRAADLSKDFAFAAKFALVLLFFSAGLAKIRFAGLQWAFSEDIQQYLRALLPANREVLGLPWILNLRETVVRDRGWLTAGLALAHIAELLVPLALFSKFFSRFFAWFFLCFVLGSFIGFGINFLSILPLLLIWIIWDDRAQDLYRRSGRGRRAAAVFTFLALGQLSVTLFSEHNHWPLMINDMYAKPYPFPVFDDLQIRVTRRDGSERLLSGNEIYNPLMRMHLFVALFRMGDDVRRTAFLTKVFDDYRFHLCKTGCDDLIEMKALMIKSGSPEIVAKASLP